MPDFFRPAIAAILGACFLGPLAAAASPSHRTKQDIRTTLPEIRLLVRPKLSAGLEFPPGIPSRMESDAPSPAPQANLPRYPRFRNPSLENLERRFSGKPILRMCPWDPAEGTVILRFPRASLSEQALVDSYKATGLFDIVEVDGIGFGHGAAGSSGSSGVSSPSGPTALAADPNDQHFTLQYGLKNPGIRTFESVQSRTGADIKAVEAWEINPGSESILVAVMDCGVKTDHPDIAARVHVNAGEIAGNGKDDEGNGFTDDVNGWAFANDSTIESRPGSPDIRDDFGHGTNIAGIIGAIGGNGIGMAGVARCRIMPVKVLNRDNWGYYSWWAAGIRYAVDNGARIINMSMGGPDGNTASLRAAVEYALQRNVIIVVSMGNGRTQVKDYPAAFDGVIAVGATGPDDRYVKSFPWDTTMGSNFGSHISVCAPGNFIYGLHHSSNTNYGSYWSGTSQAAPHVAGVCALLLAQDPSRKPADVKRLLEMGADDGVGDPAQDTPGFDVRYGHGRLNAKRSLAAGAAVAIRRARNPPAPLFDPLMKGIRLRNILGRAIPPFP